MSSTAWAIIAYLWFWCGWAMRGLYDRRCRVRIVREIERHQFGDESDA